MEKALFHLLWCIISSIVVFALFILMTGPGFAQEWVARYNGPANDRDQANALAVDNSGNVYVTGESRGDGTYYDFCTISYDSDGNERWVQRYNGPENYDDIPYAIAVDDSGNVYVTGQSSRDRSSSNYCTISYDSDGNERWVQRYDRILTWNGAAAIAVDDSGNVYVTGINNYGTYIVDYCTISYDSDGNQRWIQRYDAPGNGWDFAAAIAVDNSGNVYVTGASQGDGTSYDYCTIKYLGDPVASLLQKAIDAINNLDDDDFKSRLLRGILLKRINSALSTYEKGFTNIALVQLKCDVIEKMDGCAKRDEPDKGLILYENDWLITCEAQNDVYPLIESVIEILDFDFF